MKKLTTLAHASITAVNEYDFRSPNEVQKVLDELGQRTKKTNALLDKVMATSDEIILANANKVQAAQFTEIKVSDRPEDKQRVLTDQENIHVIRQDKKNAPRPANTRKLLEGLPVIPKAQVKNLATHFGVVTDYLQQLELLDSLGVHARIAFKGSKKMPALQKEFDDRKKEVTLGLNKALDFLDKLANNHVPDSVQKVFNQTVNPVIKQLKGRFKRSTKSLQVNAFEAKGKNYLQFTQYVALENLMNDKGYTYKIVYLIVSCLIDKAANHSYYVSTAYKMIPPSTEDNANHTRGFGFTKAQQGVRLLQTHLKLDESLDLIAPGPLPIKEEQVPLLGLRIPDMIKSKEIDEDNELLTVITKPGLSDQQVDNVIKEILKDIGGLIYNAVAIQKLKYTNSASGKSRKLTFHFSLPMPRGGKEYRDNVMALRSLKTHLNLSEQELKGVSRILQNRATDEDN